MIISLDDVLSAKLIDKGPKYDDLGVSETLAIAAFTTVSTKDFEEKVKKALQENKVRKYLETFKDILIRGYASLTTTPVAWFNIVGTRVEDQFFTSVPFGSYNVMSQRYVKVTDFILPKELQTEEVKETLNKVRQFYEKLLKNNIPTEVARRILPLATPSHIFAMFPFESIAQMYKEKELSNLPISVQKVINEMINQLNEEIQDYILQTPQFNFSIPHIFHKRKSKFPLELKILDEKAFEDLSEIDKALGEYIRQLKEKRGKDRKLIWEFQRFIAENAEAYRVKVNFPCSISCYNELKRHRTIPLKPEGIYYAAFNALENEGRIHIPKVLEKYKGTYLNLTNELLKLFEKYSNEVGVEKAIYLVPQNIIINVELSLNFNQLFNAFLFARIRSCVTAEFEIRERVWNLIDLLSNSPVIGELVKKYLKIGNLPLPKCVIGYCPEPASRQCKIYQLFLS